MKWILNDLSLEQQFHDLNDFSQKITEFLKYRQRYPTNAQRLFVSKLLGTIKIIGEKTFVDTVNNLTDRNLKKQILSWINKSGPYWEDSGQSNDDDYFHYNNRDVTYLGLGECARRKINHQDIRSFSLAGPYNHPQLTVQHGLPEEPLGCYDIDNDFGINNLHQSLDERKPLPKNWPDALAGLTEKFTNLNFAPDIIKQIAPVPFSQSLVDNIEEKLNVLSLYLESRHADGTHSSASQEILTQYFHGDKAWFSDSSATEKNRFRAELSFIDLNDGKKRVFGYHGKIKTPQIRLHFDWPIEPTATSIQMVYIGPKLTKH